MLRALLYLRLTSFQNWLRSRLRRLRQPKYFFGAVVGIAYFYFFFFRPLGTPPHQPHPAAAAEAMAGVHALLPTDWLPVAAAFGATILFVVLTFMWVVPSQRATLGFSEAEIAFLFPAPITRRALVHFRLLSAQFRTLVGAVFLMLLSNRWDFLGGNAFTHAMGWWFIFSVLNLHYHGANFTLTRLGGLGLGVWRRRAFALALFATVIVATYIRLPHAAQLDLSRAELGLRPLADWLVTFAATPPLAWLLWPLQILLGPFLAADAWRFLLALGPALAVIVIHYAWVVRSAVAFEESSIAHAEKRAARLAAWRSGKGNLAATPPKPRADPFRLRSLGRPELAFLWKNLLSTWPYFTRRAFLLAAAFIAIACTWLDAQLQWRVLLVGVGSSALIVAAYLLVIGPQFARQDLRQDLAHADILKTYPLAGWQIVLGQLLAPAAILTGLIWLALLTAALASQPLSAALAWLTPPVTLVLAAATMLLTPVLVMLQLLVPNAAALLFPAWFQTTRMHGGGPEVFGQRMIFFFAQMLAMLAVLLPAAMVAAVLFLAANFLIGPLTAIAVAASVVITMLVAEACGGVWWLGRRFEQLDLSVELRA